MSEFTVRSLSAIVYASLVLFATIYSSWAIMIFLMCVLGFCLYEYASITKMHPFIHILFIIVTVLLSVYLLYFSIPEKAEIYCYLMLGLIVLYSSLSIADLFDIIDIDLHGSLRVASYTNILLHFTLLCLCIDTFQIFTLILPLFVFTWVSDVGAYLVGRKWGKTPLYKKISPKKTIEGSLGALVFVLLTAFIWWKLVFTYSLLFWLCFGCTIWLFSSIGDLAESKLKRQFGSKDSSQLIPGHGGFLDRFDGFYFAIPWFLLLLYIFKII